MQAYILHVPRVASPPVDRFDRLKGQGWTPVIAAGEAMAATCGSAEIHRTDDFTIVGIARLNDQEKLQQLANVQANTADLLVLLALRRSLGSAFVNHLSGAFSFAIIDHSNNQVEAYRDHFGVIPFYYVDTPDGFTCGSDLRATLHVSAIPIEPDRTLVADYVIGQSVDFVRTAFAQLSRLPPAHYLQVTANKLEITCYWTLTANAAPLEEEVPNLLRDHLDRATHETVRDTEKLGTMMSGGLDSSTLTALASTDFQEAGRPPLKTLSFVYEDGKSYNETAFIKAGNDKFAVEPHFIQVDGPQPLDEIGVLVEDLMDFCLAPGLQKSRQIYAVANNMGLDVLLDGHGGDEAIWHGWGRLIEQAAKGEWRALFTNMRGAGRLYGTSYFGQYLHYVALYGPMKPRSIRRRVIRRLARLLISKKVIRAKLDEQVQILNAELAQDVDPTVRYADKPLDPKDFQRADQLQHIAAVTSPLGSHAFECLHRISTLAGVEVRYPFYDRALVEFCVSAPSSVKLRVGYSRWMLRAAMADDLPDKICWRTDKADFAAETIEAVKEFYAAQDEDVFAPLAPYIDVNAALSMREGLLTAENPDVAHVNFLWRFAFLNAWVQHLDKWRKLQQDGRLIA